MWRAEGGVVVVVVKGQRQGREIHREKERGRKRRRKGTRELEGGKQA